MRTTMRTRSRWIQLPPYHEVPVETAGPAAYQRPRPKYPKSQSSAMMTMRSSSRPMRTSIRPRPIRAL